VPPSLTLTEFSAFEFKEAVDSLNSNTQNFLNPLNTQMKALVDYGFTPFFITQLADQKKAMIWLFKTYISKIPNESPQKGNHWDSSALSSLDTYYYNFKSVGEDCRSPLVSV
jgi:hypothetical protein